jgi:hypothetical protein
MKLKGILQQLPQDAVESLARQRLSQVTDIRLPHTVLVDELAEVFGTSAYVTAQVGLRHPPCFGILHLLLNAPDFSLPAEGFRQKVQEETERMVALANRNPLFPKPKQYGLYLKMLVAAWELDNDINPSEANLLRALRSELGISLMEHFVIEHHTELHRFWQTDQAYENERNHLRNACILFSVEGQYVLPEETVILIRRAWGIELSGLQFQRLLDVLTNEDLRNILDSEGLNISGKADERKTRILDNYVLPRAALEAVNIESLREAARTLRCRPYGAKDEVIENILDCLDSDDDLRAKAEVEAQAAAEAAAKAEEEVVVPETRELSAVALSDLLGRLTNESLYDILSRLPGQRKSGSKEDRAKRLLDSTFSERTLLTKLNNEALHDVCRQLGLNPYGPKEEKITRLLEAYRSFTPSTPNPVINCAFTAKPVADTSASSAPAAAPEVQLPRLRSVRTDFPFLNESEQIVLSYLLDFKSLTDPELEKLVQRFALPWFLPKAQMAELIAKLTANGREIVQVRALGDHNIYQTAP